MNKYVFILFFIYSIVILGQVSEPKEGQYGCTYLEEPNYIVNKESVFFENCFIHRKVDVNPKELKVIYGGLAFDNTNMFYNGIKLNITPNSPEALSIYSYNDGDRVYWINNGILYRNEIKISTIDTSTFKVLGGGYYKDKNHVFFKDKILINANRTTFVFNYPYGYDKNAVYSGVTKIRINGSLQSVNGYYFKDSTTVYQYNSGFLFDLEPRYDINIQNIVSIPGTKFGIVNDTLYYLDKATSHKPIDIINSKVFSEDFIGFDNKVIYKGFVTEKFDLNSIQVLNSNDYTCTFKDKNGSYDISLQHQNQLVVRPAKFTKEKQEPYNVTAPVQMSTDTLYRSNYPLVKKSFLKQGGMTNFDAIELVSILKGYRMGCSRDTQSASNYYILKNSQGFWELILSSENTITFIGETYKF